MNGLRSDRKFQEKNEMNLIIKEEESSQFGFRKIPIQEKAKRIQNHFDSIAQKYDRMNTLLSFGTHHLWKRTAIQLLELKPGEQVLDACGGTGDLSILAVKQVGPSGRVVLYDINRMMMETGRQKRTHAAARQAILYVQGDAEQISCRSQYFDAVMVGFGVRNLTHMEQGLREMYRVLKPGGRFVCLEFSKPTTSWFRRLYDFYSFRIMPWLGSLLAGSRQAYTYLPESIRLFPSPPELSGLVEKTGFREVTYYPLFNGIAVLHVGMKSIDRQRRPAAFTTTP
jgi:demethylmenaquinone methyltransferase/2-methoxy-6-polyprenyl-1,4-benzoquinol methylase